MVQSLSVTKFMCELTETRLWTDRQTNLFSMVVWKQLAKPIDTDY
jgi:hypothetical protein